ncbi:MAG: hypothetical protein COB16_11630 [Rhodobacteraceae bacterium]|nr:MAG: hypothetical protein COB16_11630 [Paracoccaceae bacterium]
MTLSLVIPVCDDVAGARTVVAGAVGLGIFSQIILSDDGSEVPLSLADFADLSGLESLELDVLRSETCQGAGAARNLGLAQVRGSHVLFFDADDHLLPPLADLWHRLQGQMFDFCIFKHIEQRRRDAGIAGLFADDEARWQAVGARHLLSPLDSEMAPVLARIAAYPWNKIYRTDFLRDNDITCGQTLVHNDIVLHWLGFIQAQTILCADILCCEHVVGQARNHLTNRNGVERLQVFDALAEVMTRVGEFDPEWQFAFTCFYLDLLGWARERIQRQWLAEFDDRAQGLLHAQIGQRLFARINRDDPYRARRITETLIRGG